MKRGWSTASAVQVAGTPIHDCHPERSEGPVLVGGVQQLFLESQKFPSPDMSREAAAPKLAPGASPGYVNQVTESRLQPAGQVRVNGSAYAVPEGLGSSLQDYPALRLRLRAGLSSGRPKGAGTLTSRSVLLTATILLMMLFATAALAQSITGTATNGTTGKPAAGDDVTLIALSQGMQEIGSTKSDAQGKFSFPAPPDRAPHMVRVTHGGVNYFPQGGPLMPGATTAEVTVYDTAKRVEPLNQTVEVDRYQSDGKQLQVIALFAIQNASNPPRTWTPTRHSSSCCLQERNSIRVMPKVREVSRSRRPPPRLGRRTLTLSTFR